MLTAHEREILEFSPVFSYIKPEAIDRLATPEVEPSPLLFRGLENSLGKLLEDAMAFQPTLDSYLMDIEVRLPLEIAGFPTEQLKEAYVNRATGAISLADRELLDQFDAKVPPSEERLLLSGYALLSREVNSLEALIDKMKTVGSLMSGVENPTPADIYKSEADRITRLLYSLPDKQSSSTTTTAENSPTLTDLADAISMQIQVDIDLVTGLKLSFDNIRGFVQSIYNKLIDAGLAVMEDAAHDILQSLASGITKDMPKWRDEIAKARKFVDIAGQALTVYAGLTEFKGSEYDNILTDLYNRLLDTGQPLLLEKLNKLITQAVDSIEEQLKPMQDDEDLKPGMSFFLDLMTNLIEQIADRLRNLIKEEYKKLRMEAVHKQSLAQSFNQAADVIRIRGYLDKFNEALARLEELMSQAEAALKDPTHLVRDWLEDTLKQNAWLRPGEAVDWGRRN